MVMLCNLLVYVRQPTVLTTSLTHKGLFPCVDANMVVQGGHFLEGAATVRTLMGFVVRVIEDVLMVTLLEGEGLATLATRIGGLSYYPPSHRRKRDLYGLITKDRPHDWQLLDKILGKIFRYGNGSKRFFFKVYLA